MAARRGPATVPIPGSAAAGRSTPIPRGSRYVLASAMAAVA